MLAKVVNDDAGSLAPRVVLRSFASKLAPTGLSHVSSVRQCEALLFSRRRCIVSALCGPLACGRYARLLCPDPFPVDKSWVVLLAWP
ncbi:hypothetical protein B4O85_09330 [Pseudomonas azotoformans]|uniref:Uncharacterized protein n=1 Tax=Pseudomonas azotoformans TaxID=47878 RepID=A0A4Q0HWE5_PSEAZ|nr:hypothetical protein B4O85_09330 [Pseudomonas azotoformans]